MKYHSINQLENFQFQNSQFSLISYHNSNLAVTAKHLNIRKGTELNLSEYDMEIKLAKITFNKFDIFSMQKFYANNTTNSIILTGKEAENAFIKELQQGITIHCFWKDNDSFHSLNACGTNYNFTITFTSRRITIAWDNYLSKAQYEIFKSYTYKMTLTTPQGCQVVDVRINTNEENEYATIVDVSINYNGEQFCGHGSDYFLIDAFADLQNQLPKDVLIKCCLTCRHGNMCPVGNRLGELFCTNDVIITQKSDLYYYTEHTLECEKRSRQYTDVCEKYQPQTDEYFTYNDYLPYLKKTNKH